MIKIINLADPTKSDVDYEIFHFPDGEPHIKFTEIDCKPAYIVKCRVCNPDDLLILLQVGDILDRREITWDLYIYYLMGMRMDRVISFNEAFTLKVVANLINSMGFNMCSVVEPHSEKTTKLIHNCSEAYSPRNMYNQYPEFDNSNHIIVYPDEGAWIRYSYLGAHFDNPIVCCKKVRDTSTGNLLSFSFGSTQDKDLMDRYSDLPVRVVDDLCDGGGTFMGIAQLLNENNPNRKKSIDVIHAVNEAGIIKLCNTYDNVYITNSYKDWSYMCKQFSNLHVVDIL